MTTDYNTAVKDIYAAFKAAWDSGSPAIVGYMPEVRYRDVLQSSEPDSSKFWCRISQMTVQSPQKSLSNDVAQHGLRRFETSGLVFVQIFGPVSEPAAAELGRKLAVVARDAFKKPAGSGTILFRNARIAELANETEFVRFNAIAEYEYSELS